MKLRIKSEVRLCLDGACIRVAPEANKMLTAARFAVASNSSDWVVGKVTNVVTALHTAAHLQSDAFAGLLELLLRTVRDHFLHRGHAVSLQRR